MGRVLAAILAVQFLSSCGHAQFFLSQKEASQKFLLANISRADTLPGVIVASPSTDAPNYYFHWIRDAALTANVVVDLYKTGDLKDERLLKILLDYVSLSRRNQVTPNLSGGLGEPKFNVDGSSYDEPWGRPQNDGPALRAITLIHFANVLLAQGKVEYVRKNLYDDLTPSHSVIKVDLEYLETNWQNSCFDIWEETKGNHFYTMMVQRRAFVEGAALAQRLGDFLGATRYREQIVALTQRLETFWNPRLGYVIESQNQVAVHAKAGLDTAVLLAVLHGYSDDEFYSPTNDKILATAIKLKNIFERIYGVNGKKNSVGMMGRYSEDTYDGIGDSEGNPWFITTFAFAELFYRASQGFSDTGEISVTSANEEFFQFVAPRLVLKIGRKFKSGDQVFRSVIEKIKLKGDEFVKRALSFTGDDGSMSEQINRDTGALQGAKNLTWSHASFLNALAARARIEN